MTREDGSAPHLPVTAAPEPSVEPLRADRGETLSPQEFEVEVQQIASPLMGTALRLTRKREDAEDLVQETLYRAYRSLASFQKGSRFKSWAFRILHNTFINRSKREAQAPKALDPAEMSVKDVEHPVADLTGIEHLPKMADAHFSDEVKSAVDDLVEVYRVPMVLFALGDLSYQEIADTLGIPIGTVMSRLHRARRVLKERLGEYARDQRLAGGGPRD